MTFVENGINIKSANGLYVGTTWVLELKHFANTFAEGKDIKKIYVFSNKVFYFIYQDDKVEKYIAE